MYVLELHTLKHVMHNNPETSYQEVSEVWIILTHYDILKIKESVATEMLNKIRIRDQFWSVKTYFDLKKLIWGDACGPLELNLNKKLRLQIRFYPLYNKNLIISLFSERPNTFGCHQISKISGSREKEVYMCILWG